MCDRDDGSVGGGRAMRVSIFLSPLEVHVNRRHGRRPSEERGVRAGHIWPLPPEGSEGERALAGGAWKGRRPPWRFESSRSRGCCAGSRIVCRVSRAIASGQASGVRVDPVRLAHGSRVPAPPRSGCGWGGTGSEGGESVRGAAMRRRRQRARGAWSRRRKCRSAPATRRGIFLLQSCSPRQLFCGHSWPWSGVGSQLHRWPRLALRG